MMGREPRRSRATEGLGNPSAATVPKVNVDGSIDQTSGTVRLRSWLRDFPRRHGPGALLGIALGLVLAAALGGVWHAHELPGLEPASTWAGWMEFLRSGAFGAIVGGSAAIYSARKAYSGVRQNFEHTRKKDERAEQWARFERLWKWAEGSDAAQSAAAMEMLIDMIDIPDALPDGMETMIMSLTSRFDDETGITPEGELVPTLSAHRRGVAQSSRLIDDASRVSRMYMASRASLLQNQPPVRFIAPPPDAIDESDCDNQLVPDEGVEFEDVSPVQLPLANSPTHVDQVATSADLPWVEPAEEAWGVPLTEHTSPPFFIGPWKPDHEPLPTRSTWRRRRGEHREGAEVSGEVDAHESQEG